MSIRSIRLTPRQRLTFLAHLFKAIFRQHHRDLRPLFARYLPPDGVALDVGAHAGQFTKLMAGLATRGHVYAFEPGAYARSLLEAAIRWRRLRNVTMLPVGVSDAAGSASLALPVKAGGALGFGLAHIVAADPSLRSRRPVVTESVPLITLDAFVADRQLSRLDFIKADTEGWEVHLLRGAMEAIERFRPALFLELVNGHLARAGTLPAEVWERLGPLGYAAYRLDASGDLVGADEFAGDSDYLFVPERIGRRG